MRSSDGVWRLTMNIVNVGLFAATFLVMAAGDMNTGIDLLTLGIVARIWVKIEPEGGA